MKKEIHVPDAHVSKNKKKDIHYFTNNDLELPYVIAFRDKGDYTVHIGDHKVIIETIEKEED